MKLAENLPITGTLYFYMSKSANERGELVHVHENLVVKTGLNWIAQRIASSHSPAPADMAFMGIGRSTIAPTLDDTGLIEPLGDRTKNSSTQVADNRTTFTSTFPAGMATGAVTEAGLFDAATGGSMMSRSVFPVVNKQVDDFLTVLWVISIGTPV